MLNIDKALLRSAYYELGDKIMALRTLAEEDVAADENAPELVAIVNQLEAQEAALKAWADKNIYPWD